MSSVWIAAIWAVAAVIVCALILHCLGRPLAGVLDARRRRIEANIDDDRAAALERLTRAQLARDTTDERAEHERAMLHQKTVEAIAAAEVAQKTLPAQVAEQEQVIAARAEGRALAARDKAARGGDADTEALRLLLEAYATFRKHSYNSQVTFEDWLGDIQFVDGQLSRR